MRKYLFIAFSVLLLFSGQAQGSDSRSASSQYSKANALFASAHFHDALILYQKLLSAPPQGVTRGEIESRIGDVYFRIADYQKSLEAYRAALKDLKESEQPQTQYWVGFCCFLLGRDDEAMTEFLKIPERYPDSGMWVGTAYYWAGRACERSGRKAEAAGYYRKAGGSGKSTQGKFALGKAAALKK